MTWEYQRRGKIGKMDELKSKFKAFFERFKYPIIIMVIGVIMMLLPGTGESQTLGAQTDIAVSKLLSDSAGVGKAVVLISDKGVIVVCEGADKAEVKLKILRAIESYTGYGSEKITILKMAD